MQNLNIANSNTGKESSIMQNNHKFLATAVNNLTDKAYRYITWYSDGTVSSQKDAICSNDVIANLGLSRAECKNAKTRLVIAYADGHINILNPKTIFETKITQNGKRYKNGSYAVPAQIAVCNKNDYLLITSKRKNDGMEMLRGVCVNNITLHKGTSMQAHGNKVVDCEFAEFIKCEVISSSKYELIAPVVRNYGYSAGFPLNDARAGKVIYILAFWNNSPMTMAI